MPRNDGALDQYGFYRVPSLDRADHCPESVHKIFQLIQDLKYLRTLHFLARAERTDSRSVFDTNAAHDYNMTLGLRAEDLAHRCCDPDLMDAPEDEWVQLLSPRVFLTFDRREEEELDTNRPFHHWYATSVSTVHKANESKVLLAAATSHQGAGPESIYQTRLELEKCGQLHLDLENRSGKISSSGN